jgi:hypothetical protein
MANEVLIQQLDSLRAMYDQQQKRATALQSALKALPAAQTNAQRILQDYQTQNAAVDVAQVQGLLTDLRLKEEAIDPLMPELRRENKQLAAIITALKDSLAALRSDPVDVVRLGKALTALQAIPLQPVIDVLPSVKEELEVAERQLSDAFGVRLRDALAVQGIALGARPPRFEIGRFELEANFAGRSLSLRYGKDVVIPRLPITIDAAVKAYQNASKTISGRTLDAQAWLAAFYDAYSNVQRKRAATTARANIVECYIEMVFLRQGRGFLSEPSKRTFNEYSRPQFIYDFYEVTAKQRVSHQGLVVKASVATRSQTDNPTRCMWIVEGDSPNDGRYIGDIEFVGE